MAENRSSRSHGTFVTEGHVVDGYRMKEASTRAVKPTSELTGYALFERRVKEIQAELIAKKSKEASFQKAVSVNDRLRVSGVSTGPIEQGWDDAGAY